MNKKLISSLIFAILFVATIVQAQSTGLWRISGSNIIPVSNWTISSDSFTGAFNNLSARGALTLSGLLSCTGDLETNSSGQVVCGTDQTGSGTFVTSSINSFTTTTFIFTTSTVGADFYIATTATGVVWNLPDASASARGLITTGAQTLAGTKTFTGDLMIVKTDGPTVVVTSSVNSGSGSSINIIEGDWAGTYRGVGLMYRPNEDRFYIKSGTDITTSGGTNALTIDATNGRVGVGLANGVSPVYSLEVSGNMAVTGSGSEFIFTNASGTIVTTTNMFLLSALNCTQALETDTTGKVICGTDATGSGNESGLRGGATSTVQATTTQVIGFGGSTTTAKLYVVSGNVATTTLHLDTIAGQTAEVLKITSSSASLFQILPNGQVNATTGTLSIPSYSFIGDTDTGIYNGGANKIALTTNGVLRATFDANNFSVNSSPYPIRVAGAGDSTAPDLSSNIDSDTGLVFSNDNTIRFSTNAIERGRFDTTGLGIGTTTPITHLSIAGNIYATGSATTSNLYITNTTTLASIVSCTEALETDSAGRIVCGTDVTGGGGGAESGMRGTATSTTLATSTNVLGIGDSTTTAKLMITSGSVGTTTLLLTTMNQQTGDVFRVSSSSVALYKILPSGQINAVTGTAALPSYSYVGDTDTGMFSNAANNISITVGGNNYFTFDNSGNFFSNRNITASAGSASAPSFSLNIDSQTGVFLPSGNIVGFSSAGTEKGRFNSTGLGIGTTTPITHLSIAGNLFATGSATTTNLYVVSTTTLGSILNCTEALETDSAGRIICGTDATGGAGSFTTTSINSFATTTFIFGTSTLSNDFYVTTTATSVVWNIPSASASNRGLLTASDWSTFNNKESALTFSTGLNRSGNTIINTGVLSLTGTANQITVSQATGTITLSTPQNIDTAANVQFNNVLASNHVTSTSIRINATSTFLGSIITGLKNGIVNADGAGNLSTTTLNIASTSIVAGNYLTLTGSQLDVDPEIASSSVTFNLYDPTTTAPYNFAKLRTNVARTIQLISCDEYAAATTTINIYKATALATTTNAADIVTSMTCGIGGNSTTTFGTAALAVGDFLFVKVTAISGTPSWTTVNVYNKKDD